MTDFKYIDVLHHGLVGDGLTDDGPSFVKLYQSYATDHYEQHRVQETPPVNFARETVHLCPFCDWSLFYTETDPAGVEAALADHLDEEHDLVHRTHLRAQEGEA